MQKSILRNLDFWIISRWQGADLLMVEFRRKAEAGKRELRRDPDPFSG
jgi:hypothetical protein